MAAGSEVVRSWAFGEELPMLRGAWTVLVLACVGPWLLATSCAKADEFERIEGEALAGVPRSKEATSHAELSVGAIDALPNLLRESRSALLVATTDQGNFARMLVVPALRKVTGGDK